MWNRKSSTMVLGAARKSYKYLSVYFDSMIEKQVIQGNNNQHFNKNFSIKVFRLLSLSYLYKYIYTSSRFLQQDPESLYSFGKIQRAAVCPTVFNTQFNLFNLSYRSYLMKMYIFIYKRYLFKPFSYETCSRLLSKFGMFT